jgi:hypothetical protein
MDHADGQRYGAQQAAARVAGAAEGRVLGFSTHISGMEVAAALPVFGADL